MTLKLEIPDSELGDIIEKRDLNFDFNGPKNDALDISKKLINIFSRSGKACELIALVAEMRKKYGPRYKKVKKCYTFKEKVKCLLRSGTERNQFGSAIRKLSYEEYNNFLFEIADLKLKRNLKEYFMKMRFFSQISKSASVLSDLEEYIPSEGMIDLITSKLEIDDKVYGKYSRMFGDEGTKEVYPVENKVAMIVNDWEVANALVRIAFDKDISSDYLPGLAYKELLNLKTGDKSTYNNCCKGLAELLTELLKGNQLIPEELFCAMLLCLNKCPDSRGKLENIRPISIIGVVW